MNAIQAFEDRHKKILDALFLLVLALGLGFRFYQYLMGRSLWEDEAHLALNFLSRDFSEILKPLDYIQAGPPLYLLTTEAFTQLFGNGPMALRALPFVASILTLQLFYYALLAITRSRIAALIGFLPFAVNIAVIYYSSELKTYGMDVAVYVLLFYLSVSKNERVVRKRNLYLTLAGCLGLLYSNIAFILLFSVGCCMLLKWLQNRKVDKEEVKVMGTWAIVFAVNYFLFIHNHPYEAIQRANYTFAFPPRPFFSEGFNTFMAGSIDEIAFRLLLYVSDAWGFGYVLLLFFLVAIRHAFYRKKYTVLLLTLLPLLVHFTLALLHIYPFWYRLILYFVPALLVLIACGAFYTAVFLSRWIKPAGAVLFIIVCSAFFTFPSFKQYPLYHREIKPALDHINQNYPGSFVYITTPYTLYKYYYQTGYARDSLYEGLDWNNGSMSPETYYKMVEGSTTNYLLLHAEDPGVDSFHRVLDDLKKRNLIVKQFTSRTYTVSEIRPLNFDSGVVVVNYTHFPAELTFDLNGRNVVPVWAAEVSSKPVVLKSGRYRMTVVSGGTGLGGIQPHLTVFVNDRLVGDYSAPADYSPVEFSFEQVCDGPAIIKIVMDNDALDPVKNEDRNAFIHSIRLKKLN